MLYIGSRKVCPIITPKSALARYKVIGGEASAISGILTGDEFSNIQSIANSGMARAFDGWTELSGAVNMSNVTTIGSSGLSNAFYGCTGITSVDLSSVTTIGTSGLQQAFMNCTSLTTALFTSLTSIGTYGLYYAFRGDTALKEVYFNALTTTSFGNVNAFNNMLMGTGTGVTHKLHFPSNLETTIQGLTGYPNFGGTSGYVSLAFDLTATS